MSFKTFKLSPGWFVGGIKMLRNLRQMTTNQISRMNFRSNFQSTRSAVLFSKN